MYIYTSEGGAGWSSSRYRAVRGVWWSVVVRGRRRRRSWSSMNRWCDDILNKSVRQFLNISMESVHATYFLFDD